MLSAPRKGISVMTINSFTALLFAAVLTLQGCGSGTENHKPAPAPQSIVDVASADGRLTDFILALETTGLDTNLSDMDSKFTDFAPTCL